MAAVELARVHKHYGATQVVKGLSLTIGQRASFVALLGPSGCGKTTTLRMIAGLERLDAGTHLIDRRRGRRPGRARAPRAARAGHGLPELRRLAAPLGRPERRLPADAAARAAARGGRAGRRGASLGAAESFAHRMPHALSGGQLQRVAIARALVAQPRVLLLDEPLSNLDAALREELRGEIAALRARLGTTMVFVTHDQGEALALADRVAVMNDGVIEQLDTPEAALRRPGHALRRRLRRRREPARGPGAGALFVCGEATFALPEGLSAPDGPATLVVRPEDLRVGAAGPCFRCRRACSWAAPPSTGSPWASTGFARSALPCRPAPASAWG